MKAKTFLNLMKNNSSTILTAVGCVGMIITTALGVKAGLDLIDICEDDGVDKKKALKTCAPAIVGCAVSMGCVVGAEVINRRQKSDLLALCATICSGYSSYRHEVIKRYGEKVDEEIIGVVGKYCDVHYMAPEVPDKLCRWRINTGVDSLPVFEIDAYERDVMHAEMHVNRNYILGCEMSVKEYLDFLGIKLETGEEMIADIYGWAINDSEIYFLDFEHRKVDDNTFEVHPIFMPWHDYWHLDMFGNEY